MGRGSFFFAMCAAALAACTSSNTYYMGVEHVRPNTARLANGQTVRARTVDGKHFELAPHDRVRAAGSDRPFVAASALADACRTGCWATAPDTNWVEVEREESSPFRTSLLAIYGGGAVLLLGLVLLYAGNQDPVKR